MSNLAYGSRAEKTLEILKEKKFYVGLDKVYATFELSRLLTIDKTRDDEPTLVGYLQKENFQEAKDYLKQQICSCKERFVALTKETFQRKNLVPVDLSNAIFGSTDSFESTIRDLSCGGDLSFARDIMQKVSKDIRKLER